LPPPSPKNYPRGVPPGLPRFRLFFFPPRHSKRKKKNGPPRFPPLPRGGTFFRPAFLPSPPPLENRPGTPRKAGAPGRMGWPHDFPRNIALFSAGRKLCPGPPPEPPKHWVPPKGCPHAPLGENQWKHLKNPVCPNSCLFPVWGLPGTTTAQPKGHSAWPGSDPWIPNLPWRSS